MTRFKSSTTTTSHPPGHGHGHAHAQSDLETTNASIFRDVLSEPVIRCLVAESSKETEKSAREKRLRKRREKNRRKEARGREDEGIVAEEVEEDGDDGDDDNDKQDNGSDIEELGDFIDYLSSEIFTSLPDDLRTLTYAAVQEDERLASKYTVPLSASTVEDIATRCLATSIADSLTTYDLFFFPPSNNNSCKDQDLTTFLRPILTNYITSATAPPLHHPSSYSSSSSSSSGGGGNVTSWRGTRAYTSACQLCSRDWVPLTYHHLIPRSTHARVLKRGWHRPEMLNVVAWLCRPCHDTVHRVVPSNEDLARYWYSVDLLMQRDDVKSFTGWVARVRGLAR